MVDPKASSPAPPARSPLLDLNTLIIRPLVRIDDVNYEMRAPEEVSVLENHRLLALGKRVEAIEAREDATETEQAEYEEVLGSICCKVLLAPAEVIGRLTVPQRAAVALTFSRLWLMTSFRAARAILEAAGAQTQTAEDLMTGASSSPPLSAPTGAIP